MHLPNRRSLFLYSVLAGLAAALAVALLRPAPVEAQRNPPAAVAQVSTASPLPVYVVNEETPRLPDGFVPGSSWTFTTWTTPSTLTFAATVKQTEGGWALLTVTSGGATKSSWYYVPHMPGAWSQQ